MHWREMHWLCFTFYCLSTLSLFTPSRLPLSFLPFLSSLLLGFLLPSCFSSFRLPTLSFFHPTSFVFLTYFLHTTLRSLISCCLHSFSFLPRPVFCFPSLIPFLPSYFILSSFKPYVFFPFSFLLCFPSFLLYFSSFCHAILSFCCFFSFLSCFSFFPMQLCILCLSVLLASLPSVILLSFFLHFCMHLSFFVLLTVWYPRRKWSQCYTHYNSHGALWTRTSMQTFILNSQPAWSFRTAWQNPRNSKL